MYLLHCMDIFLGIDNSSNKSGLCIINTNTNEVHATTIERSTKQIILPNGDKTSAFQIDTHPYELIDLIDIFLKEYLDKYIGDNKLYIYLEKYTPGKYKKTLKNGKSKYVKMRAQWTPLWMQGFISSYIYLKYKIKPIIINHLDWKLVLNGKQTIRKELVESSTYKQCTLHNWHLNVLYTKKNKQDLFDAFGIAFYAYRQGNNI